MLPLPGVTDLVVHNVEGNPQIVAIRKFLLEEYFPDLRRLTLGLGAFRCLWNKDVISLFLDQKWLRLDAAAKGIGHCKIIVFRVDGINDLEWESSIKTTL